VSIGEALAEARRQAGMTVTDVSRQTCIRETIIRGIERDDYSACGGDFYARGHIRSVAHAVGADPGPLIREYDTIRQAPDALTAAEAFQPITPLKVRTRQGLNWTAVLGLVLLAALGFLAYYVIAGSHQAVKGTPATGHHAGAHHHAANGKQHPVPGTTRAAGPYANKVVIHLTAIRGCRVEFVTPAGLLLIQSYVAAGTSKAWTFYRAVDMTLSNPSGITLSVDGKNPLPSGLAPRPVTLSVGPNSVASLTGPPRPAARVLTPASASAFGAGPGPGDNGELAPLAIDGKRGTAWHTDWYTTARFGNLVPGTGLLLGMGRTVTVTAARITLGRAPGASLQLRVGAKPSLADLRPVAHAARAGGVVHLRLATPARGRYVLIWFTRLPPDPAGTFQASVHDVRLTGSR